MLTVSLCCVLFFVYLCPVSGVPNVDSISVLCSLFVYLCPVSGVPNVDSIQTQDRDKQTKPQYRDTVNIGYTRHRAKTNKQKTQHRDTVNIGYTRHRTKTNKQKHNTEILSTLGTPDTGQRLLTVSLCCVF
jgi:hypothetical protein